MKRKFEVELWAPDGFVACVRGAKEALTTHKYLLMWIIGVTLIAFGANGGEYWYIWFGIALGLTGFFREVFRDREETDILERWTVRTSNVAYWYVGTGLLAIQWPESGYLVVLGCSILCHLIMLGLYHLAYSDDEKKMEKAIAEAKKAAEDKNGATARF